MYRKLVIGLICLITVGIFIGAVGADYHPIKQYSQQTTSFNSYFNSFWSWIHWKWWHPPVKPNNTNNTTIPKNNSTVPPPIINTTNNTTAPPVNNTTIPGNNSTPVNPPVDLIGTVVNPGMSIQTAINNAKAGDTIIVNPGVYNGFTINKGVTVVANGTVNLNSGVSISGNGATLKGFTITADYAVSLSSTTNASVLNNRITSRLNGIMDSGTNTGLLVANNVITGTNVTYGNGMAFEGMTNGATIRNNTITGTQHGILFDVPSTNNLIEGNTVHGVNGDQTAIYTVLGSTNFTIINNVVTGEQDGIALQAIGSGLSTGFIISGNICTNNYNAIWMTVDDSNIFKNNLSNNKEGIDIVGGGNVINNNTIQNNSVVGIALTTTTSTDVNIVANNTMSGNGGNYYNAGPGSVIGE